MLILSDCLVEGKLENLPATCHLPNNESRWDKDDHHDENIYHDEDEAGQGYNDLNNTVVMTLRNLLRTMLMLMVDNG